MHFLYAAARVTCAALPVVCLCTTLWSQEGPTPESAIFLADHGAAALVLFMTAPGLAMFYGGLVRQKNVLNAMMQYMFWRGLTTVIWALYSLSFGAGVGKEGYRPYVGNERYFITENDLSQHREEGYIVV